MDEVMSGPGIPAPERKVVAGGVQNLEKYDLIQIQKDVISITEGGLKAVGEISKLASLDDLKEKAKKDLVEVGGGIDGIVVNERKTQPFSNAQPVWHFVLLSIVTFGIYEVYWFYRNWKQLKIHKNLDISPGWRTVGLFVPIYNVVLMYRQFRDIRDFAKDGGYDTDFSPASLIIIYLLLNLFMYLPDHFTLLGLLNVLPLAVVQGVLNPYWRREQPTLIERTSFSGGQVALLIIFGILWIPILLPIAQILNF